MLINVHSSRHSEAVCGPSMACVHVDRLLLTIIETTSSVRRRRHRCYHHHHHVAAEVMT